MIKKIVCVISLFSFLLFLGCDGSDSGGGSGSGGGGGVAELPNIEVTGISAEMESVTIDWFDPDSSNLVNINVLCSDGSKFDINAGTETNSFTALRAETKYKFTFTCEYSDGRKSGENTVFVTTAALTGPNPIVHTAIATATELIDAVNSVGGLAGNYFLTTDLDVSGSNWTPIGEISDPFTGIINGNGHNISGVVVNNASNHFMGFFGFLDSAVISSVNIVSGEVTGSNYSGGLAGYIFESEIINCSFSGTVSGAGDVGGLVGNNYNGTISNSFSSGTVSGSGNCVGGLVGNSRGQISNCYSLCNITGVTTVGGLVGSNFSTISICYSTGNVSGTDNIGGLIGSSGGDIDKCYSTGNVSGTDYIGGLIGSSGGDIDNCYSKGAVTGNMYVGGLVGDNGNTTISNCFSSGAVSGSSYAGGLIGIDGASSTLSNLYWNITVNSTLYDTGSVGNVTGITSLTTDQMKDAANVATNYVGWDFTTIWNIDGATNDGYPFLR